MKTKSVIALALSVMMALGCLGVTAIAAEETGDVMYTNGNIYTVDENFSKASIIVTKGQNLLYVGSDATAAAKYVSDSTQIVDLKGKTVIPGLIEGHMHLLSEGTSATNIDIFWQPKEYILEQVKTYAATLKPGEWIDAWGWNNEVWADNSWPTKEQLDAVSPNNPVILSRADGHSVWVNSLALKAGGVTKDTPNPQGGEVLKNDKGEVLGVLVDTAIDFVSDKVPEMSDIRKVAAYKAAQDELFSYGLTSVMDAGETVKNINLLKTLYESGDYKLRVYEMLEASTEQDVLYLKEGNKPESGLFDGRLAIKAVKMYSDGSLGSRSAWMLEQYEDRHDHKGNGRYTDEEMYTIMKRCVENGFQVGTHAIGDAAVRQVIATVEKIKAEKPDLVDPRFRIEHFQIVNPSDIPRAIKAGIIPAMQAVHATSDKNMAEDRIGAERMKGAYAWHTIIKDGGKIVNGSDAPVELVNPYHGLYAAVTRRDRQGEPAGGWYPNEAMTREEALRSFTIWAAYGQFEEKIKGSLEAGKLADFVVLDRDVMTCYDGDIKDTKVLCTVLGGEVVYEKDVQQHSVTFIGKDVNLDDGYKLEGGRIYVPAEALADAMGAEYALNDDGTATITYKEIAYKFTADSALVDAAGKSVDMTIATISDGKLYIPVRGLATALGLKINWYPDSKEACISF